MDQARLKQLLRYIPETGQFVWIISRGTAGCGRVAGNIDKKGYRQIMIDGRSYFAHRLAWLYHYGTWPEKHIDHIDCDKDNNKISNIRLATNGQNRANARYLRNPGRLKGTYYQKPLGRWQAQIAHNKQSYYLGLFDTEAEAHAAYMEAAVRLHGEFARAA